MKKLTIPLASLFFSIALPCSAHWLPVFPDFHSSWVVGGSVSYAERLGDLDTTMIYTHPLSFDVPVSFIRDKFVNTGSQLGLLVGYQIYCHRCVFGLELSLDRDNVDEHYLYAFSDTLGQVALPEGIAFNADALYERGITTAITARWGYRMGCSFMPYARFGFETSRDHLTVAFAGNPGFYPFDVIIEDSHRNYRYVVGVGGEWSYWQFPHLGFRFEYNFHSKGERLYATGAIYDNIQWNPVFEAVTLPKMHSLKFAVVWNFSL